MGRGQQQQLNTEGTGMLNTENNNSNSLFSTLMPAYQGILANPGYTPAQQSSITNATLGGLGAAFGSAQEQAANQAARTGNTAGLTSTQDALSRARMTTAAAQTAQNQTNFANDAQKQQAMALQGLGSMYGANLSGANNTLGTLAKNAETPGFGQEFGAALAKSLGSWFAPGGLASGQGGGGGGYG